MVSQQLLPAIILLFQNTFRIAYFSIEWWMEEDGKPKLEKEKGKKNGFDTFLVIPPIFLHVYQIYGNVSNIWKLIGQSF